MDHSNALATQAAERYLLGELPADEAEEFEIHYFECPQCALAVESGDQFIAAVREGIPEAAAQPVPKPQPRTSLWDSVAAFFRQPAFGLAMAGLLAPVVIYQNAVLIPQMHAVLNTARPLTAVLLIGAFRGEDTPVPVAKGDPFVSLAALPPSGANFKEYVSVLTRGGQEILRSVDPAPTEGDPITILIPSRQLRAGSHVLTLYGRAPDGGLSDKIQTYPFTVQLN